MLFLWGRRTVEILPNNAISGWSTIGRDRKHDWISSAFLLFPTGLLRNGKPVLGVICDPIPDVGYSAEEGSQLKIY